MRSMTSGPLLQPGERTGAGLVERAAGAEAVEAVGSGKRVRLAGCERVRKAPARGGRRLEATVTPAAIQVEAVDRRRADDRAGVRGHVHHAAPVAQKPDARHV